MNSSWIESISYDHDDSSLTVATKSGETYDHWEVPKDVAQEFKNAPSKGAFYNTEIRGSYDCELR